MLPGVYQVKKEWHLARKAETSGHQSCVQMNYEAKDTDCRVRNDQRKTI